MTQEEKAKRYDEAIQRAMSIYNDKSSSCEAEIICEKIFPELIESEDEKMWKLIKKYAHYNISDLALEADHITREHLEAWLEKQKSVEEIVERCKNSWYNEGKIQGQIEGLTDEEKYQQGWHDALEKRDSYYTKRDVDDAYLKGVIDTKNEIEKQYKANYQIRKDIATFIFNYKGDIKDRAKWMDYLGIDFSFVEKQSEQKHTPKHKVGDTIYYNSFGELKSMIVANVTTDSTDNPMYEDENGSAVFEKDLVEHNPAWSVEDEMIALGIGQVMECASLLNLSPDKIDKIRTWLKSLKDRVGCEANCTTTKEWSVDDSYKVQRICKYLDEAKKYYADITEVRDCIEWLKSLRPQPTWKPSDEQIECLYDAIKHYQTNGYPASKLNELYEQMSKIYKL